MFKKFHPEHFVCSYCLKQLKKGTFKEQSDKPYCHGCFERLFGWKIELKFENLIDFDLPLARWHCFPNPFILLITTKSISFSLFQVKKSRLVWNLFIFIVIVSNRVTKMAAISSFSSYAVAIFLFSKWKFNKLNIIKKKNFFFILFKKFIHYLKNVQNEREKKKHFRKFGKIKIFILDGHVFGRIDAHFEEEDVILDEIASFQHVVRDETRETEAESVRFARRTLEILPRRVRNETLHNITRLYHSRNWYFKIFRIVLKEERWMYFVGIGGLIVERKRNGVWKWPF